MSYVGECSGCGKCCTANVFVPQVGSLVTFYCENLIIADRTGTPQATLCAIHSKRTLGMKVNFYTKDGRGSYTGRCLSTYPRSQDAIPPECSYKYVGLPEKKPQWSIGYKPKLGNLISEIW